LAKKAVEHGTRAGYRAGCRDNGTTPPCPASPTCNEASNQYQADLRQARREAAARTRPVRTGSKPHITGIRVVTGNTRSETRDTPTGPMPDMPTHDAPDYLANAVVSDDPEPDQSDNDWYHVPDFVVTPGMRNDIAGKLGLFAAIIGMPLETMDSVCGPVFAANVDNMINAYLPIICRSPGAVKFFQSTSGGWLDWIKALQATWPVIKIAYLHHLARSVGHPENNGVDPLKPPADNFNYSAV